MMGEACSVDVVRAVRRWIGTPYRHQHSTRGHGCDCLGLLRGVYRDVVGPEPEEPPRYSPTWAEGGKREFLIEAAERNLVRNSDIHVGSVVIFRMKEHMIAKHCGIVVTPGTFIHAIQRRGVNEEPLTDAWRRRIADVFVYPEGVS